MKTWTAIALGAVAAVGTAAAIALWKRRQDEACCRYDSDEMDDDEFFCEDCGSCGVCDEEELDVEIPSDADEAVDAVKEAAEDAAEKAEDIAEDVKDAAEDLADDVADALDDAKDATQDAIDDIKDAFKGKKKK